MDAGATPLTGANPASGAATRITVAPWARVARKGHVCTASTTAYCHGTPRTVSSHAPTTVALRVTAFRVSIGRGRSCVAPSGVIVASTALTPQGGGLGRGLGAATTPSPASRGSPFVFTVRDRAFPTRAPTATITACAPTMGPSAARIATATRLAPHRRASSRCTCQAARGRGAPPTPYSARRIGTRTGGPTRRAVAGVSCYRSATSSATRGSGSARTGTRTRSTSLAARPGAVGSLARHTASTSASVTPAAEVGATSALAATFSTSVGFPLTDAVNGTACSGGRRAPYARKTAAITHFVTTATGGPAATGRPNATNTGGDAHAPRVAEERIRKNENLRAPNTRTLNTRAHNARALKTRALKTRIHTNIKARGAGGKVRLHGQPRGG